MQLLDNIMFTHSQGGHLILAASMDVAIALGLCDDAPRQYLWVVDKETRLGCVDVKTAQVTVIGKLGIAMSDISFDHQGRLLGMNGGDVYHINTTNASLKMLDGTREIRSMSQGMHVESDYRTRHQDNVVTIGGKKREAERAERKDSELAFDLARFFMKLFPNDHRNMVQLAVIDGTSMDIGVFGYGTVYGRAKTHLNLFQLDDPRIYTIDSKTGNPTSIAAHPRNRLRSNWRNLAACSESS